MWEYVLLTSLDTSGVPDSQPLRVAEDKLSERANFRFASSRPYEPVWLQKNIMLWMCRRLFF